MTEPTDAEIIAVMRDGYNCRYNDEQDHVDFARAVLAKWGGPQAGACEPLTDEQAKALLKNSDLLDMFVHIGWYSAPRKNFDAHALTLIRSVEAAHGIKGGQHE